MSAIALTAYSWLIGIGRSAAAVFLVDDDGELLADDDGQYLIDG
jgi:hypothetical protein